MAVTNKDIEERFEEAARTLRALPDRDRPQGYQSGWPDVVRDACESYGYDAARTPRITPSPAQISRMEETFTWLKLLEPRDARIVWLRAERVPWRLVCSRVGYTRKHARRRLVAALNLVAEVVKRDIHNKSGRGDEKGRDKCPKFRQARS